MKKSLSFNVEIEFESEIVDDNDIMNVAENIALAIKDGTNSYRGIAPTNGDTYSTIVRVTPQYINKTITEDLV
jgi:hypothetical protein